MSGNREYAAANGTTDAGLRASLLTRSETGSLEVSRDGGSVLDTMVSDLGGFMSRLTNAVAAMGTGGAAAAGGSTRNR